MPVVDLFRFISFTFDSVRARATEAFTMAPSVETEEMKHEPSTILSTSAPDSEGSTEGKSQAKGDDEEESENENESKQKQKQKLLDIKVEDTTSVHVPSGSKKRKKEPTVVKKEPGLEGILKEEEEDGDDDDKPVPKTPRKSRRISAAVEPGLKCILKKEEKEDDDCKPVPKKHRSPQRISEATVKDAAEKMLSVLITNYKDGIKEVPMDILASSITSKLGKSYKNPRSDAIQMGLKLLKAQGKAEKNATSARLLQSEIDRIPREEIAEDPAKVLEQRYQQFLDRLASNPKGGKGEKVVMAASRVWAKLCDGKAYTRKQLVQVTSYKGTNSSGFEAIMKVLNELRFVEGKKGQSSFTDKVFPHGRP